MKDLPKIIILLKKLRGLKTDKDVAELLNINARTFETDKFRGKIPYEEIISFCSREGLPTDIFFLDADITSSCTASSTCKEACKICEDLDTDTQNMVLNMLNGLKKPRDGTGERQISKSLRARKR
jgi:hypothetical protein